MNGICGVTELLLDTTLNDRQKELVALIKKSGELMLLLVNVRRGFTINYF